MRRMSVIFLSIPLLAASGAMAGDRGQRAAGWIRENVQVGREVVVNAGPASVSSTGSVGVGGGGASASYNPRTREACVGVGTKGGAGVYGRGTAAVCTDGNQTSVKISGGVGTGAGVDAGSVGVTTGGYIKVGVPNLPRAPMTGVIGNR